MEFAPQRQGEAIYQFNDGMLPSDFFRRNVVLSFHEDAIGIRLRDSLGSTWPQPGCRGAGPRERVTPKRRPLPAVPLSPAGARDPHTHAPARHRPAAGVCSFLRQPGPHPRHSFEMVQL